ncbi:putative mucin/carbohydrate-binding domain-containing protein [Vagococcus entomophilus]|uniref:Enhancin n=1 Tax=Vagococcus entomophilus TaxID=1160095 RepID=A0A430AI42_9ENTE|nr:putative mucin/carbohydrate-binding domain-containing protein [Vagococcus entomophilus]RSU07750.1 enhancin [Vagococcus entomophilus]
MKKSLLLFCLMGIGLLLGSGKSEASEVERKEILSLTQPTWIFNSGMSKGKYHDRQELGFILKEKSILKVRQVNPEFQAKLTVRLLGNDSQTEKSVQVGSEWTQISGEVSLVPFVDTPYGDNQAQIEYEILEDDAPKPLAVYNYQENEQEFFSQWDMYDGEFALIKGKDFQLFLPKRDKELARHLKEYNSLDELIEYYGEIFSLYNEIAGFDESSVENVNGSNRYFLKADAHGAGGAYYGNNWTANSYGTANMWLTKNSWATLHEIGHGYQAGFDGVGMYTEEVSNNLFGVQYQYKYYGKQADKIGWLFNYGKKAGVEKNLYQKMVIDAGGYNQADLREKLILLTMLKQKAGDEAFTKMYQGYRKLVNEPNFNKHNYPLPELINHYYSENSQQDFTPALERIGLTLKEDQDQKNRNHQYPAVAFLADVVPEKELERAHELLDSEILINSNFEMVQTKEIASLGLKGNVIIRFNSEELGSLDGIKVALADGADILSEQTIQGGKVSFENIPNGVYRLSYSGEKMKDYLPGNFYVYVKESANQQTIPMKKMTSIELLNQTIHLLGLSNAEFASFKTDLNRETATFSVTKSTPHSYFSGKLYSKVTIKDTSGNLIYEKSLEGTNASVGAEELVLKEGYVLEIYHAEVKNRLRSDEPIIDNTQKTNRWLVTKWGLQNQTLKNDPQKELRAKIDDLGMDLLADDEKKTIPFAESIDKKQLYHAINRLEEPVKSQLMNEYHPLFQ